MEFKDAFVDAEDELGTIDLDELKKIGVSKERKDLLGSHTVVTYPPLDALQEVDGAAVFNRLKTGKFVDAYIHIPFCEYPCKFCPYTTMNNAGKDAENMGAYFEALKKEISTWAQKFEECGSQVQSLYIGGGTPFAVPPEYLSDLMTHVRKTLPFVSMPEICMETSPSATLEEGAEEKLETVKNSGVTRMSIGIQTFDFESLRDQARTFVGHSPDDEANALRRLISSGIPQINADMIQDLPLLSKSYNERLQRDLEQITAIDPHHITWYNMRLRPETTYAHMEIVVPSERESLLTRLTIWNYLEGNGYKILEGDRFAKEEKNEDKFRKTRGSVKSQLIGMGVSAYSHVPGENFGQREGFFFQNSRDIGKRVREDSRQAVADYIRKVQEHGHAITFGYPLTVDEEIAGTFALGLKKGVDLPAVTEYIETTPEGAAYSRAVLTDLISLLGAGLIIIEDGIMKFSRTGRLFENELSAKFYTPRAKYLALQRRKQESENKVASAVHQKSLPILKVKTEVGPSDTDRISTVSYETSIALNRVMTEQRGF